MAHRIVLDTDMASDVDDALCLALALAAPELEILAVTHVGREPQLRARVTRKLLELAGRSEIPAYAGCRVPVLAGEGFNWFGHEGVGILEDAQAPCSCGVHSTAATSLRRVWTTTCVRTPRPPCWCCARACPRVW